MKAPRLNWGRQAGRRGDKTDVLQIAQVQSKQCFVRRRADGALARLETAQNLRQYCALKVQVDWLDGRGRRIRVAVDGELVECTLPLVIEAVPDALQVIVQRQPETNR